METGRSVNRIRNTFSLFGLRVLRLAPVHDQELDSAGRHVALVLVNQQSEIHVLADADATTKRIAPASDLPVDSLPVRTFDSA